MCAGIFVSEVDHNISVINSMSPACFSIKIHIFIKRIIQNYDHFKNDFVNVSLLWHTLRYV